MSRMNVNLAGVELKNQVMTASGTFGSGAEYSEFVDLNRLGAVVTKGVANVPWPGNPTPRVTETASGMLNAIGLQNPGIDKRKNICAASFCCFRHLGNIGYIWAQLHDHRLFCRCSFSYQYPDRNEDRYQQTYICTGK